jgi:hypothetical protein
MSLSLKESNAVRELARLLYSFLPGSGNRKWKGHVTFESVASRVGVGAYWPSGSKEPAIAHLLEQTLDRDRRLFEPLIVEVVRSGLTYRKKQGDPVRPDEITKINAQILALGFKFPALWDSDFSASLSDSSGALAAERVKQQREAEMLKETARSQRSVALESLKSEFFAIHSSNDRQKAGLQLEKLLNRLFRMSELAPREPFRVQGEQIDGSFELDNEIYLFEAKWHQEPRPAADLYVFREKVEGKSRYTRGLFLSINGITEHAKVAIAVGKQLMFFAIDGHDLMMVLENRVSLADFLRRRQRLLAEEGRISVPFGECGF